MVRQFFQHFHYSCLNVISIPNVFVKQTSMYFLQKGCKIYLNYLSSNYILHFVYFIQWSHGTISTGRIQWLSILNLFTKNVPEVHHKWLTLIDLGIVLLYNTSHIRNIFLFFAHRKDWWYTINICSTINCLNRNRKNKFHTCFFTLFHKKKV